MAVVYYDRVHPYRGIDNPEVRTEEIPGADPGCYDNRGSAYNIILASGTYTSRTTGTIFRPSTRKGTISRQKKNSEISADFALLFPFLPSYKI